MDRGAKTVMGQQNDYCVALGNAEPLTIELNASQFI